MKIPELPRQARGVSSCLGAFELQGIKLGSLEFLSPPRSWAALAITFMIFQRRRKDVPFKPPNSVDYVPRWLSLGLFRKDTPRANPNLTMAV